MRKKLLLICIYLVVQIGCTKEKSTNTYLYIQNSTQHKIQVIPFKNGIEYTQGKFSLTSQQKLTIGVYSTRGISNIPLAFPEYMNGTDSIRVIYDSTYTITHYLITPVSYNSKFLLRSSNRNIGNIGNYINTITIDKKYQRSWDMIFTSTEQDYLDAK